jgi:hypothetical protein
MGFTPEFFAEEPVVMKLHKILAPRTFLGGKGSGVNPVPYGISMHPELFRHLADFKFVHHKKVTSISFFVWHP